MLLPTQTLILAVLSLFTLSACASTTAPPQSASPAPVVSTPASPPATPSPVAAPVKTAKAAGAQHGGQVVEMGNYHLELLAAPEGEKIHVDFWLLTGANHAAIADAQVVANIQFPSGTQKSVNMVYDQAGKHYKALVPGYAAGEYRVVVQTTHQGEKVNGRFNFKL